MFAAKDLYRKYMDEGQTNHQSIKYKLIKGQWLKVNKSKRSVTESFSEFRSISFCMVAHARCNIRRPRVALPNNAKEDFKAFECLNNFPLKINFNRFENDNAILMLFCQVIGFLFERQWNNKQITELKSCLIKLKYPTGKGIEWIQQIVQHHFSNKNEEAGQQQNNLSAAFKILKQVKKGMTKTVAIRKKYNLSILS